MYRRKKTLTWKVDWVFRGNWLDKSIGVFCHVGSGLHVDLDNAYLNARLLYNSTWMTHFRFLKLTMMRWKSDRIGSGEGQEEEEEEKEEECGEALEGWRMWREAEPRTTVWKAMSSNAKVIFENIDIFHGIRSNGVFQTDINLRKVKSIKEKNTIFFSLS